MNILAFIVVCGLGVVSVGLAGAILAVIEIHEAQKNDIY